MSRCVNKRLEEDGRQLRKHLELFTVSGDDDVCVRARVSAGQYLWQFLEEIQSVATILSPQEVFNRRRAASRLLLLV